MRCLICHQDDIPITSKNCPKCGVVFSTLFRDVLPSGTILNGGAYRIEYVLGRGGFGITYRGIHALLDSPVAIKEYFPQECVFRDESNVRLVATKNKEDTYQKGLQRFIREGRILKKLAHHNVVQVQNLFEECGTAYLVMELIEGNSLAQEISLSPSGLAIARIEKVFEQLTGALSTIHKEGVYHLDLKPDNIMIAPGDQVKLIDFGAARQGYTSTSTQAFSLEYAAPEVMSSNPIGPQSDIFELGMILHELLTGSRPPSALARFTQNEYHAWRPTGAGLWETMLEAALKLDMAERPDDVRDWWNSRTRAISLLPELPGTKHGVICPSCQHKFRVPGSGIYHCPMCQWKFEVDTYGGVILGTPILAICPNCRFTNAVDEAGQLTCKKCRWTFMINKHGDVIGGKPIKTECPSCGNQFQTNIEGVQRCSRCKWEFEIDRAGAVMSGKPIFATCPNPDCVHEFSVKGAGEWTCPACKWKFTVNRYGVVIAGKPIKVTCPVCSNTFRVPQAGAHQCPVCRSKFEVNRSGVVISEIPDTPSDS